MATIRKLIVMDDNTKHELEVYINDNSRIYLCTGNLSEDISYQGYITLDKEDALALSKELNRLAKII